MYFIFVVYDWTCYQKIKQSPIVNHEKLTNARFLGSEIGTNRKIECHYFPVTRMSVLIHFDWTDIGDLRAQVQF
jgi:hypothetical protein